MVELVSLSTADLVSWAFKAVWLMARRKGPLIITEVSAEIQPRGAYLVRVHLQNYGRKKDYTASCVRLGDYGLSPFDMSWEGARSNITLLRRQVSYINVAFVSTDDGVRVHPVRPGWADEAKTIYNTHNVRAMADGRITLDIIFRPNRRSSRKMGLVITFDDHRGVETWQIPPC